MKNRIMLIKNPLLKGEVREIAPNIFGVVVKDRYQRGMLFCRYQEFYESPYKEIRGKHFTLEQYMDLYRTKNKKHSFTYPSDWSGYNIPSKTLWKALDVFSKSERREYDEIMSSIIHSCENYPLRFDKPRVKRWYLLGADSFDSSTMDHEISHGLYYTNKEYRKNCDSLISEIKKGDYNKMKKQLIKIGYADDSKIIDDEIQAYMSTGLISVFDTNSLKKYTKGFEKNFKSYRK
jgi:hypothetical protein